jgi:hypothetical protein
MSSHQDDVKRRTKASLYENNTLEPEALSSAADAYDTATGHATGVAQFEAMLEFLAEGQVLYLKPLAGQGAPARIRTAQELAEVVEARFPYVSLRRMRRNGAE